MPADVEGLKDLSEEDRNRLELAGLDMEMEERSGSFFQVDQEIRHAHSGTEGIEVLPIAEALQKYEWFKDYYWNAVDKDLDRFTQYVAKQEAQRGFAIIAHKGAKAIYPLQACLYLAGAKVQYVHNIVIAEEGAELHLISGCVSAAGTTAGAHIGVTEIYVGKNARVTSTMIHNWSESISVYPRSATVIEEGGVFLSNYVCMQPVRHIDMNPIATLKGKDAVARFSSVVVGLPGSELDLGSRAILKASGCSAEVVSRMITRGGNIISRGEIRGEVSGTKGHIECKGLILEDGMIHAIPEIAGLVVDTELSHEAAVGRIARDEIEYLMSRGLDEETATATIIRGFLDVKIRGLPETLQRQIDAAIDAAEAGF